VLTWAVYQLAMNPDVQETACEEVRRVCSETGDITTDDVDNMTYVSHSHIHTRLTALFPGLPR